MVSEASFATLGVRPLQGRTFTPVEHGPGQGTVMILDADFWQRQFAGQRDVVGQDTVFNGATHKIVGVVRDGMAFMPAKVDVWIPMAMGSEGFNRENHARVALARLKPGVSLAQGSQEINRLAQLQKQAYPNSCPDDQWGAYVQALRSAYVGDTRLALLALLAAVGFVLLIACANVANLMAARSAARRKELAVRSALGGHRLRILRQLLTESLLLSALGGDAGLILAFWGIPVFIRLAGDQLPQGIPIGVNLRALGFTLVLTLLTGVLFGVMAAPGVETVGATSKPPLALGRDSGSVSVEDLPASQPGASAPRRGAAGP